MYKTNTIAWHLDNLRNMIKSRDRAYQELLRRQEDYVRINRQCQDYNEQIARAKREGKDSFDRDRYNKRRSHV